MQNRLWAGAGRWWWWLWSVVALPLAAACDPCSGVASCGEPWIRYDGELVMLSGEPAESMRVEFVRTEGIGLASAQVVARPDASGRFRLEARATEAGEVVGDLLISSGSGGFPDRFTGVRLATTPARGEVRHLGQWRVVGLKFGGFGELFYRAGYAAALGVEVEFRRVAGIPLEPDTFVVYTDQDARFPIRPTPLGQGEVVFDLIIRPPAPYRTEVIPGLRLSTRITEQAEPRIGVWLIGPYFPYLGLLVWGDTRARAAGVEIEFRRTSGIPVSPQSYVARSNENGHFPVGAVVPLGYGELVGEVMVRPPPPYRTFTIPGIRLQTLEEDVSDAIIVGTWEIPRQ